MSIYDFTVKDMNGNDVSLAKYKGKVLLIVNTATECGFTPQYDDLQGMYEAFKDKGFEILDFPCNQFGHQAPGTEKEIAKFCTSRFGVTFPQFAKIEVNGEQQSPLFAYLKKQKGFSGFDTSTETGKFMDEYLQRLDKNYAQNRDIKWNFTKFLISKKGEVVARFEPTANLDDVADAIVNELQNA